MCAHRAKQSATFVLLFASIFGLLTGCAPSRHISFEHQNLSANAPTLAVRKDIDMVRVDGVLSTPEQASEVYEQISALFGESMLIHNIAIDDSVMDAQWVGQVVSTLEQMADIEDFSVVAADGQLLIGGTVSSMQQAELIADKASTLAGVGLAVSSDMQYPPDLTDAPVLTDLPVLADPTDLPVVATTISTPEVPFVAVPQEVTDSTTAASVSDYIGGDLIAAGSADMTTEPLATDAVTQIYNGVPVVVAEQPAVAALNTPVAPVATIVKAIPTVVADAVIEPVQNAYVDSDADGVSDQFDQCASRNGYPVDDQGCQVLDGYLNTVRFTGQATGLAENSEPELDELVSLLQTHPIAKIAIISYAQDETAAQRGQARQRAFLVATYLQQNGVDRSRLQALALSPRAGVGEQVLIKEID